MITKMVSEVEDMQIKYGNFNVFLYYIFIKRILINPNNIFIYSVAFNIEYLIIKINKFTLISSFTGHDIFNLHKNLNFIDIIYSQFLKQNRINKLL